MEFPDPHTSAKPSPFGSSSRIKVLEGVILLVALLAVRACLRQPSEVSEPALLPAADLSDPIRIEMAEPEPLEAWYGPPTPQRMWNEVDNPQVYMPTGSGRIISASYGSVRTNSSGRASFHEGVDIGPTRWERGRATDAIFAVADGEVAYINRAGGNSSYGIYVVIAHQDRIGEVYTLYSHLASVPKSLSQGDTVTRGQEIGIMGHSSTLGIPQQRSHLHFEICMMLNPDFLRWYQSKKLTPSHDRYHGFNLIGLNPHLLLTRLHDRDEARFSFAEALRLTPTAWTLLLATDRLPSYFQKYPTLWQGDLYYRGPLVMEVSESGAPLSGRPATPEEIETLGTRKTRVLEVNTEVLGRNGTRHILRQNGVWDVASAGERWLEILLYRP